MWMWMSGGINLCATGMCTAGSRELTPAFPFTTHPKKNTKTVFFNSIPLFRTMKTYRKERQERKIKLGFPLKVGLILLKPTAEVKWILEGQVSRLTRRLRLTALTPTLHNFHVS